MCANKYVSFTLPDRNNVVRAYRISFVILYYIFQITKYAMGNVNTKADVGNIAYANMQLCLRRLVIGKFLKLS